MDDLLEQLQPSDYDELVAHLDEVYGRGPTQSFRKSLCPIALDRQDMDGPATHERYGIRRNGRLVASAGVFTYRMTLDDQTLWLAGIGTVSTSPACRQQGLMSRLMTHLNRVLPEQGFSLGWLIGRRRRYRRFGWEIAGSEYHYELAPVHLEPPPDEPVGMPALRPLQHVPGGEAWVLRRRRQLPFRVERPGPLDPLRTRIAMNSDGQPVGYLVTDTSGRMIVELVGDDVAFQRAMIRAVIASDRLERVTVCLPPFHSPLHRDLAIGAAPPVVRSSGSWRIFDWRTSLLALLSARHRLQPLLPGELVIEITGVARLRLRVETTCVEVHETTAPADFTADSVLMTQLLLGHLTPSLLVDLPAGARILDAWRPLPLHMPHHMRC